MDKKFFISNIAFLSKYFRYTLDPDYAEMYWNTLKQIPEEKFTLACKNIFKEFIPTNAVPFPLVAHFLAYCGLAGKKTPTLAIDTLKRMIGRVGRYESINFGDSALHYVIESFGGWVALCNWDDRQWDVNEGRMKESYEAAQTITENEQPKRLTGIIERENGLFRVAHVCNNGKSIEYKKPEIKQVAREENTISQIEIDDLFKNVGQFP